MDLCCDGVHEWSSHQNGSGNFLTAASVAKSTPTASSNPVLFGLEVKASLSACATRSFMDKPNWSSAENWATLRTSRMVVSTSVLIIVGL